MTDPDASLRGWLEGRFDTLDERLTGIERLLVGNGHPGALSRLRVHEERLDAHAELIAYDRSRIDILRDTPKKARVVGSRWGAVSGGLVSAVVTLLTFLSQFLPQAR